MRKVRRGSRRGDWVRERESKGKVEGRPVITIVIIRKQGVVL